MTPGVMHMKNTVSPIKYLIQLLDLISSLQEIKFTTRNN